MDVRRDSAHALSSVQVRPERYTSTGTLPFEALAGMKRLNWAYVPPSTSDCDHRDALGDHGVAPEEHSDTP